MINYETKIDWSRFFKEVDLIHNDQPILLKNFIPNTENLLSWKDVENVLNSYIFYWEIFDGFKKIDLPQENSHYLPSYFSKKPIQSYIKDGKTFIIGKYSIYNSYTKNLCSEIENLFPVTTEMHVYGSKGNKASSFHHHFDLPSNFIIQTYGECEWKVYSNSPSSLIQESNPNPNISQLDLKLHTTLKPGDMLYIPSKFYHAAFPNQPRLSISIPCYPGVEGRIDKNYYQI